MQGITFELDPEMVENDVDREMLQDIVNNTKLSEGYLTLARDIEVMEAKTPEDIYKVYQFYQYHTCFSVSQLFNENFAGSLA